MSCSYLHCASIRRIGVPAVLLLASAAELCGQTVFRAFPSAGEVVTSPQVTQYPPPVGSGPFFPPPADGTFYLDPVTLALSYEITIEPGALGTPVAAALHVGPVGEEGPRLALLTTSPAGTSGSLTLNSAQVSWLRDNLLYVTLRTIQPESLIRGQITTGHKSFVARLDGSKVVPNVVTHAFGNFSLGFDQNDGNYFHAETVWPIQSIHMHEGPPGTNGPIAFKLNPTCPLGCHTGDLTEIEKAKMRSGAYYVDIHTAAFPDGEIRGQIRPSNFLYGDNCPGSLAPNLPKLVPYAGAFDAITLVPFEVGILFVGVAGAKTPVGETGCFLGVSTTMPYVATPVVMDMWGGTTAGLPSVPGADLWFYAQYFGVDPAVPSGMHASNCIAIHYHSD